MRSVIVTSAIDSLKGNGMKKNLRLTVVFLFIIALILAGCNGQTAATLPPEESAHTFTPREKSTITPTRPPFATSTVLPFVATRIAGATRFAPTAIVLAQIASSDCSGYPDEMWKPYNQIFSPSGMWRIAYCQYPDTGANYVKVINVKTGDFWEVPYQGSLPEGITGEMHFEMWSSDEKFAFFTRYFCCLDGPGMIFVSNYGLFQLDVSDGRTVEIESGELSPDGYSVIFSDSDNHQVVVRDLRTDRTTLFKFDKQLESADIFLWSPNGRKVVFSAADENWYESNSGYVMYLVDLNGNAITQILYSPPHNYFAVGWLSENEILIEANGEAGQLKFDITTSKLTPMDSTSLTLTPSP